MRQLHPSLLTKQCYNKDNGEFLCLDQGNEFVSETLWERTKTWEKNSEACEECPLQRRIGVLELLFSSTSITTIISLIMNIEIMCWCVVVSHSKRNCNYLETSFKRSMCS